MQGNGANVSRAVEFFENSPAYRPLYVAIVDYCREEREENDVVSHVSSLKRSASQIRSAGSLVESLVEVGFLERTILVDGVPYEGSMKDLQFDDEVPEDADVAVFDRSTDIALQACETLQEAYSVATLSAAHPERRPAFRLVLAACEADGGKTTKELEELLTEANALENDERTGLPHVYPSYFTSELERVGALDWNGRSWVTSSQGSAALASGGLQDAIA